jgi:hypothetical protein
MLLTGDRSSAFIILQRPNLRRNGYRLIMIRKEDGSEFRTVVSNHNMPAGNGSQASTPTVASALPTIEKALMKGPRRVDVFPLSCPPRGLSRVEAAAYIGVSPTLFDEMVKDGRMPGPKHVNTRRIWDRLMIDAAFSALPEAKEVNPWDLR